ncbi:MAG: hypothetical protein B7X41_00780 [Microbacterium sp. 14-71-5]|nr:MAG: hypothetical protein B7X41_00780 [Microbacterium sp. 14-71-5]
MSTIDPDAAWRERSTRRITGASLLLPGLFLLGAGAVLGWALTRGAATGFSDEVQDQDIAAIIAAIASSFALMAALGLWVSAASRNARLPGWLTAVGVAVLGAAERRTAAAAAIAAVPGVAATGAWLSGTGLAQVVPHAKAEAERIRHALLWD